jgi:hypothetical protein
VPLEFDERLVVALKALALRRGATLFMTLLAGWRRFFPDCPASKTW